MLTYKPLQVEFTKNGFQFNQMYREGDFAIFHKVAMENAIHQRTRDAGFEVVVISRHDGYEIGGVKVEPAEQYPGNEKWGSMGWTFTDLYSAEKRFNSLLKGELPVEDVPSTETPGTVEPPKTRRPRGERPVLLIPVGEFSVKELAAQNNVDYPVAFLFLKDQEVSGLVRRTRTERRAERGKPTQLFEKVS